MAEQVSKLQIDHDYNTVLVIDNDGIKTNEVEKAFKGDLIIKHMNRPAASEINIGKRRQRIAEVWEEIKRLIPNDTDLVFGIEDDSDLAPDCLTRLIESYIQIGDALKENGKQPIGIMSGIQAGRHGYPMVGAWRVDNIQDINKAWTLPFSNIAIYDKIDAAGLFGFVCDKDLIKRTNFTFGEFGPDFFFGIDVRKMGFQNFVDWTNVFPHVMRHKTLVPDDKIKSIIYQKKNGKWKLTPP